MSISITTRGNSDYILQKDPSLYFTTKFVVWLKEQVRVIDLEWLDLITAARRSTWQLSCAPYRTATVARHLKSSLSSN
ncbi:hypothetical protein AZE42_08780 [Rhizopogon vesiculosus]|uniref:Uncharacterized protein n=1 Tax=Rhizopogon vesiculosus TaxID=180088 RepID=A0A1J8QIT3_9AGAM|nr:hypothetical protein AZE42_08780 [Rhizopogon vesiculosus]